MLRRVCITLLSATALRAGAEPDMRECMEALSNTVATFALTAPGLMADETLDQRGRRGFIEILRGRKDKIKELDFNLPQEFRSHHRTASYGLAASGESHVLHEIRTIVAIDGESLRTLPEARQVMTIGLLSPDDRLKRQLLEDMDQDQLEGAVTDFGQLLLLFGQRYQNYVFVPDGERLLLSEPMFVLRYRQISGDQGLTFFEGRTEKRQPTSGEIWFRQKDLLPLRIVMSAENAVSKRFVIRTEATVDYAPTPVGLAPASVTHKQSLNAELMVENDLRYSGFHRAGTMIP